MAGETLITVVGNLTADPELRFTPSGAAVCNWTVASTPRHFDKQANEWKDAETLFLRCAIWREAAEYVAESLKKGTRVIVSGRLKQRNYEDKDGTKRTVYELDVEEVGPSLRYASAVVKRMTRQAEPGSGWNDGGQAAAGQPAAGGGAPVSSGQPAEGAGDWGGGWGNGPAEEPAF